MERTLESDVTIVVERPRYFPWSAPWSQFRSFVYAEYKDLPFRVHICNTPPITASEYETFARQLRPAFDLVPPDILSRTAYARVFGGVSLYLYDADGDQLGQVRLCSDAYSIPAGMEGAIFWPGTRHADMRGEMVDA